MLDRLDRMRLFVRVVERSSFTAAAADLSIPRSTATEAMKALESALGVRLLDRTTRHISPTLDGQAYYRRCVAILADLDEADAALRDTQPRGLLRVNAHGTITRTFLLPRLHEFLGRYPLIDLHLGQSDRLVDLVREGVDVAIRAGEPADSGLILRRLGMIDEITVASPGYLEKNGAPTSVEDLADHQLIGFISSRTGVVMPFEFTVDGTLLHIQPRGRVTVDNSDTMAALARGGHGLVQAPRYRFEKDIADGALVEVLSDCRPSPTPLSAVFPQNRQLAPRVRVFLDWVASIFAASI